MSLAAKYEKTRMSADQTSVNIVRCWVSSQAGILDNTIGAMRRSKGVRNEVFVFVAPAKCWVSSIV